MAANDSDSESDSHHGPDGLLEVFKGKSELRAAFELTGGWHSTPTKYWGWFCTNVRYFLDVLELIAHGGLSVINDALRRQFGDENSRIPYVLNSTVVFLQDIIIHTHYHIGDIIVDWNSFDKRIWLVFYAHDADVNDDLPLITHLHKHWEVELGCTPAVGGVFLYLVGEDYHSVLAVRGGQDISLRRADNTLETMIYVADNESEEYEHRVVLKYEHGVLKLHDSDPDFVSDSDSDPDSGPGSDSGSDAGSDSGSDSRPVRRRLNFD